MFGKDINHLSSARYLSTINSEHSVRKYNASPINEALEWRKKMSKKEAKALGLLPRLSANEKRVFQTLVKNGALTPMEISKRGGVSKGKITTILEGMIERGFAAPVGNDDDRHYIAVFPVMKFITVLSTLTRSLEARKSEMEATTEVVHNFTEGAIKNVREASTEEREKRTERSEEDIKDLEMAMDASFSGILASIEMDLKDLNRITKTSNEFLEEASIRTKETTDNIKRGLKPLAQNFSKTLTAAYTNVEDQLEATVDARVRDIMDFETKANSAFDEVLQAFNTSQDEFEDIIFTVLDSGIDDLERVTRPINIQIDEAISSLTEAIEESSLNFQAEMVRVLTEQKRPMVTAVDSIQPQFAKVTAAAFDEQKEILEQQKQFLSGIIENHYSIFSKAAEELANDFDKKIESLIEQSLENTSSASDEMNAIEDKFVNTIEKITLEKNKFIHNTSERSRDVLNEMIEQFLIILNAAVAEYQMNLSDIIAKLETDFLNTVDNNSVSVQNLVNYINMTLTEPVKELMINLEKLNERIIKDETAFLTRFSQRVQDELHDISKQFKNDTKKKDENFEKDLKRLKERIDRDFSSNLNDLQNKLVDQDRAFQSLYKEFSAKHQKGLRDTSKEVSSLTKKLERWRGESSKTVQESIDSSVDQHLEILSEKMDSLVDQIRNNDQVSKEELIILIRDSYTHISKSFKNFGTETSTSTRYSLREIAGILKKDSLAINNRLVSFKKEQDRLIEETKFPVSKLLVELGAEYKQFYKKTDNNLNRFFSNNIETFKRTRRELGKSIDNMLNRQSSRTAKDSASLKDDFIRTREKYVSKTQESFEKVEKTIARDASSLLDQERSSRLTITALTENSISEISNGVNSTAQVIRSNITSGAERIFRQAAAELSKQEIELGELNEKQQDESIDMYNEINKMHRHQLKILDKKIDALKEKQIGNAYEFRDRYTQSLEEDLIKQKEILSNSKDSIVEHSEKLANDLREQTTSITNRTILELEAKTSGIEGAIFSTVGNITAEASRRTEGVVVIGEQAVLGIEERYTENLERIRQKLTDQVISRIEREAANIEKYKGGLRQIGREHLALYGKTMSDLNDNLKKDMEKVEKTSMKTIAACETKSNRFLEDLDVEITAMGERVGLSTDRLIVDLLDGFDRVLQKVKREATLFARKQFELSNRSNMEIAEAFLKSVDDLEEVMLKQISSFAKRTTMSIDKTNDLSSIINNHVKDMTGSFKELSEN